MEYLEFIIDEHYSSLNPIDFGHHDCDPGYGFGPAVRTYWLLHYVVSGHGIFEYNGQTYNVWPGDIFVIPPYEQTYYRADEEDPWYYIWIGFEAQRLPFHPLPPVIHNSATGHIFQEMLSCNTLNNGKSAYLAGKIWELFSVFIEQQKQEDVGYVEKAISLMKSGYMHPIFISKLAEQLHIDRSYFCSLFKKSTGLSPQQYLTDLRMKQAATLLTVHSQTPSMVATSVGYPDIQSFSKMFKNYYGVSPRAYIQEHTDILTGND